MSDDFMSSNDFDGFAFEEETTDNDTVDFVDDTDDIDNSTSETIDKKKNPILRLKEKIGGQKFASLVLISIGALCILFVAIFFGGSSNKTDKQQFNGQVTPIQQQTHQQVITQPPKKTDSQATVITPAPNYKNADWIDITDSGFELDESLEYRDTFTIKEVRVFARNTNGEYGEIELRTELWGYINSAGVGGVYRIETPYADASIYDTDVPLKIIYRKGLNNGAVVIYDLRLEGYDEPIHKNIN